MKRFGFFSAQLISKKFTSTNALACSRRSLRLDLFSEHIPPVKILKEAVKSNDPAKVRSTLEKYSKSLNLSHCAEMLELIPKNKQSRDEYRAETLKAILDYQKRYSILLKKYKVESHRAIPKFGSALKDYDEGCILHDGIRRLKDRETYADGYSDYDPKYSDVVELLSQQRLQTEFGIRLGN